VFLPGVTVRGIARGRALLAARGLDPERLAREVLR